MHYLLFHREIVPVDGFCVLSCVPAGPMTLTRGSFSYSNGEEYHGEWKEGKTDLLTYLSILHLQLHLHAQQKCCHSVIKTITHVRQNPCKHHTII